MTRALLHALLFGSPFFLILGLPLLDLGSQKEMDLPLQSSKEKVILYFGYPGCGVSCPDTLQTLSSTFDELNIDSIDVVFINILMSVDDQQASDYARAYHSSFRSLSLKKSSKEKLFQQFNIVEEKTFKVDLQHSNFLFLLNKSQSDKWKIKRAFPDAKSCMKYLGAKYKSE